MLGLFSCMCVCTFLHVCMHAHMCMNTQAGGSPWSSFFLTLSTMFTEASQLACNPTIGQQGVREYSMQRQKAHWGFLAKIMSPGSVKSFNFKKMKQTKKKKEAEKERANTGGCHAHPSVRHAHSGGRHAHPALMWVPVHTSTCKPSNHRAISPGSWWSFKENF